MLDDEPDSDAATHISCSLESDSKNRRFNFQENIVSITYNGLRSDPKRNKMHATFVPQITSAA